MSTDTATRPVARIEPRLRDRLVTVKREQGRRRLRRAAWIAAAVAAVALGVSTLWSPLLDVDRVTVQGATHVSAAEVRAAARLGGCGVAFCDTGAAAARVERLPWVDTARVDTSWPDGARVVVTERIPVAHIPLLNGEVVQVDGDGRVLAVGPATLSTPHVELRGVSNIGAPGARVSPVAPAAVAAQLPPSLLDRTVAVVASPLALVIDNGVEVRVGDTDRLPEKLGAANAVLGDLGETKVAYIDVRVPSAPAVGTVR